MDTENIRDNRIENGQDKTGGNFTNGCAGDAYTIDRLSITDAMLQVFADLRTNRPKPLPNSSLASSRLNRGVSRPMPNMAVLQGTPTALMELLYVSSANSLTLNMESVETVELPARP
ncbi:hypothetical protein QTP88_024638 [Uroleucon formosanum]